MIDGIDRGNEALPELTDLGVVHSGRAYQPYPVSHWGAYWWDGWRDGDGPHYPGVVYEGRAWDRSAIEAFYAPWRAVEALGTAVHIGEFGCYEQTPNDDALCWFTDVLGLLREYGWATPCGSSKVRSGSSAIADPVPASNGVTVTTSTSTCSTC